MSLYISMFDSSLGQMVFTEQRSQFYSVVLSGNK